MNELRELLQKHLGAVDAEDTFGRTNEELIAEKLLNKESQKLLRQYQDNLRPVLHNALDKKIHHATRNQRRLNDFTRSLRSPLGSGSFASVTFCNGRLYRFDVRRWRKC